MLAGAKEMWSSHFTIALMNHYTNDFWRKIEMKFGP